MSTMSSRAFPSLVALSVLGLASVAHAQTDASAAFEPSLLARGITGLFAVATLVTGLAALLGNTGWSLLVRTERFVAEGTNEVVVAPNVRGWGARQVVTGVALWAALWLGDQVLFQVGLASLLLRQGLDIVVYLLDRTPSRTLLFIVAAIPTTIALLGVL
ncbi:MAG: hypothetical protein AAF211_33005 [Myxococcota bacterium]